MYQCASLEFLEPRTLLTAINATIPAAAAIGAAANVAVSVKFASPMNVGTINSVTFQLKNGATPISGRISYNSVNRTATFNANTPLQYSTSYTATVKGGAGGVLDLQGSPLVDDFAWSFTTAASPSTGSAGPILVITSVANPFSSYYSEILRAEGFNEFATADISTVTSGFLSSYSVAILGEMSLNSGDASMLSAWVANGNNLIAMRPDADLSSLLGITSAGTTLDNAYVKVDTSHAPGAGIVGQTMQYHGTADCYTLSGATEVARLYSNASVGTSNPAVTIRSVGVSGGQAAAFTFDLAKSIIFTRQGNPAWSGQERDGLAPIRPDDLFFGNASFDPQPDWVDFSKIAIPQADEQQRLLANMVEHMIADTSAPLPRFWYLPNGNKAVVVMSGDDHEQGGTVGRFANYLNSGTSGGQPIRGTSYIFTGSVTDAQAAQFTADGFEIAAHVAVVDGLGNPRDWTSFADLEALYISQLNQFNIAYPSIPTPATNRTHAIVWSDFDSQPQVQFARGIRLDASYYYWPGSWVQDRPGLFTGSALPMRYAKADGSIIDVFQLATQMTDESQQTYPKNINTLLDRALGNEGYFGAFTVNAHTDEAQSDESDAIVASAKAHNVPVLPVEKLARFTDGRDGSLFSSIAWNDLQKQLSFNITAADGADGLQAMLPTTAAGNVALFTLSRNGSPISFTRRMIKGIEYAFFSGTSGSYVAQFDVDIVPPTILAHSPGAAAALITVKPTATFNEPMQGDSISFTVRDPANNIVSGSVSYEATALTATFAPAAPLVENSTYTVRVDSGVDLHGNGMISQPMWSFKTVGPGPFSLFDDSSTPQTINNPDAQAVEVGVKFQSEVAGFITGVRFYKGSQNTGLHVGSLWSAAGALLRQATFGTETASGWQYVNFSSPVAIAANTTYVASYHTNVGHYSSDSGFFGSSFDSSYLHAPASSDIGGNGVFKYGGVAFPTNTFGATNYWVDVGFTTSLDTTAPTVVAHFPASGAGNVAPNALIKVKFSEAIQRNLLLFELRDENQSLVGATVTYDPQTLTATLVPAAYLAVMAQYTATVSGVRDFSGNAMGSPVIWSFVTGVALAPNPDRPPSFGDVPTIPGLVDDIDLLQALLG